MVAALGSELPDDPTDLIAVVDLLAQAVEPGLTAMPSGRFFGFVIGGTYPAAMAADWLTSAWDQNAGLRTVTPAATAVDDLTEEWVLDLLGLPEGGAVGFVTGGTMANFTCLAAARDAVLTRAGWDVGANGLVGSPGMRVLVGAERHDSVDLVLRYLGIGAPELVAADAQGRIDPAALREKLAGSDDRQTVVVLQAGNIHSMAFDPFEESIALAQEHGAWGACRWRVRALRRCSSELPPPRPRYEAADSWATDAHKTLNVPYDCGLAIMRDPGALRHLECNRSHGPIVIFEPGAGSSAASMGLIAPAVARDTRVCVYDRAGRGWSDPAANPPDGDQIATDLHTLLDRTRSGAVRAGRPFLGRGRF